MGFPKSEIQSKKVNFTRQKKYFTPENENTRRQAYNLLGLFPVNTLKAQFQTVVITPDIYSEQISTLKIYSKNYVQYTETKFGLYYCSNEKLFLSKGLKAAEQLK